MSAVAAFFGWSIVDAIIGIGITIAILFIVKDAGSSVLRHVLDGLIAGEGEAGRERLQPGALQSQRDRQANDDAGERPGSARERGGSQGRDELRSGKGGGDAGGRREVPRLSQATGPTERQRMTSAHGGQLEKTING